MVKSQIKNKAPRRRYVGGFWANLRQIRWYIMFVILVLTITISLVMYLYSRSVIKDLPNKLYADFISNMEVFNADLQANNFEGIQDNINKSVTITGSENFYITFVVVTNSKMQKIYSNLNPKISYYYSIENNPTSFKLQNAPADYKNNVRIIFIPKGAYNIYLGVHEGIFVDQAMKDMAKIFSILIWIILILALVVSFKFGKSISKPLLDMEKTISRIGEGDLSGRLEYSSYLEVNKLVQAYNMMANALQRLYSSLENQVANRTKELKSAYNELQSTQAMMVHSEKMKSLGELVAGIMHEINNPINFIYGNMTHLSNYSNDLINMIETYTKFENDLPEQDREEIKKIKTEIDYDFLKTDMPDLIKSCKEGADRAKNIIQDLKSFSRMEEAAITDVDIVHEIDTTLNILHNKIKHKAEVHKEYIDYVPKIEAFGGQLNQVFMNILDNAIGAIKDTGDIYIRIKTDETMTKLIIEIEDNGEGMDEETASKVFDPFFTTKPVGQGTGLGMSITHKIIKSHQGDIKVESKKGVGTKFTITLPINLDRENLTMGIDNKGEKV
ncbi:GHKL domain-containing protein [bacterium]|nr:GHKL domain-containing protein [bacterium]